jgi:thioesterase domain-containing protein
VKHGVAEEFAQEDILARVQSLTDKKRKLLNILVEKHDLKEPAEPRDSSSSSPLICMRSNGSKTPFFCVHALLGSVFHYHHLANLLDPGQPFYGLQAPGLDGSEAPLDNIGLFAERYLKAIRTVQPQGPYKLGGYSFGSWVAFQIAQDLLQQGEAVSLLVILGTGVPLSVTAPALFEQVKFLSEYSDAFVKNVIHPFLSYEQRIVLQSGSDEESLPPLLRLVSSHNKAALLWEPKPYPGPITLLETSDQQLRTPLDTSRGWKRLTTHEVETRLVSGNHLNMLDEPHVRDLAAKLTACLNRA